MADSANAVKGQGRFAGALLAPLVLLFLILTACPARAEWPHMVSSLDGTPISYEVHGPGDPALVFVHGWSCDGRYWRAQVDHFSKKHRVVIVDLAGHGHSGLSRTRYTMKAFGEDVRAATEAAGTRRVLLIGHSMGGSVIAEAARLMPERVVGLIGVNSLDNVGYPLTSKESAGMIAPLEKDFQSGSRNFIKDLISLDTDLEERSHDDAKKFEIENRRDTRSHFRRFGRGRGGERQPATTGRTRRPSFHRDQLDPLAGGVHFASLPAGLFGRKAAPDSRSFRADERCGPGCR